MGFWETAAKVGSFIANDVADTAERCSRDSKHYTEEQREAYRKIENSYRSASQKAKNWANRDNDDDYYY